MKTPIIILSIIASQLATARIGETLEQCDTRYGERQSLQSGGTEVSFEKNDVSITVYFLNGLAAKIKFMATGSDKFNGATVETLLAANQGDSKWKLATDIGAAKEWTSTDRKALLAINSMLIIETTAWTKHEAAEKAKKQAQDIEGF